MVKKKVTKTCRVGCREVFSPNIQEGTLAPDPRARDKSGQTLTFELVEEKFLALQANHGRLIKL